MGETWRVVLASGEVREVSVRAGHSVMSGVGYFACLSANDAGAFGSSPHVAVVRLALEYRLDVREILAPGEPTRAEAVAADRERCAKACDEVAAERQERLRALESEGISPHDPAITDAERIAEKIRAGAAKGPDALGLLHDRTHEDPGPVRGARSARVPREDGAP